MEIYNYPKLRKKLGKIIAEDEQILWAEKSDRHFAEAPKAKRTLFWGGFLALFSVFWTIGFSSTNLIAALCVGSPIFLLSMHSFIRAFQILRCTYIVTDRQYITFIGGKKIRINLENLSGVRMDEDKNGNSQIKFVILPEICVKNGIKYDARFAFQKADESADDKFKYMPDTINGVSDIRGVFRTFSKAVEEADKRYIKSSLPQ